MRSITALITVATCLSVVVGADQDPCTLSAGLYSEATGRACLESIKLEPTEVEKVLAHYQMVLDLNSLVPYYNDPVSAAKYTFEPFDLRKELQEIRTRNYTAAYHLYRDLSILALKMRDPHSDFIPPSCFFKVGFSALFPLEWLNKSDRVTFKGVFNSLSFRARQFIDGYFGGDPDRSKREALLAAAENSSGVVVDSLRLDGVTKFSGRPADVIQHVADTVMNHARSPAIRSDHVLRWLFRNPMVYFIVPTHRVFATIAGTEYELPWFAFVNKDIANAPEMMAPCSPKPETTVRDELSRDMKYRRSLPSHHPLHIPPESSFQSRASRQLQRDQGDFEVLLAEHQVVYGKYRPKSRPNMSAIVVRIKSFSIPVNESGLMMQTWRTVLHHISETPKEEKYFVIDLTGNGGGLLQWSLLLYSDIFGMEMARPAGGNWKIQSTEYRESLGQKYSLDKLGWAGHLAHFATGQPAVLSEHTTQERYGDKTYSTLFNLTFLSLETTNSETGLPKALFPFVVNSKPYRPRIHWQPHEIFVLTDQDTASAATMFAQKVRQFRVGRTVYVGGRFLSPTVSDPTVPASTGTCGGSNNLHSYQLIAKAKKEYNLDLPGPFRGEVFGFIAYQHVSNLNHRDVLEFMQFEPDFQLPVWSHENPLTDEQRPECLDLLFDRIEAVGSEPNKYSWKKSECDVDSAFSVGDRSLIIGGHFYHPARKVYDESVCRPVYCTENAYPSQYDQDGFLWGCTKLVESSGADSLGSVVWTLILVLAVLLMAIE